MAGTFFSFQEHVCLRKGIAVHTHMHVAACRSFDRQGFVREYMGSSKGVYL